MEAPNPNHWTAKEVPKKARFCTRVQYDSRATREGWLPPRPERREQTPSMCGDHGDPAGTLALGGGLGTDKDERWSEASGRAGAAREPQGLNLTYLVLDR